MTQKTKKEKPQRLKSFEGLECLLSEEEQVARRERIAREEAEKKARLAKERAEREERQRMDRELREKRIQAGIFPMRRREIIGFLSDFEVETMKTIDKMYSDKRSRRFVLHLVRSYIPTTKAQKVFSFSKKQMKYRKCCVSKTGLVDLDKAFELLYSIPKEEVLQHLKDSVNPHKNAKEHPFAERLGGRLIAFSSEETDTLICIPALRALRVWVMDKLYYQDRTIEFVVNECIEKEEVRIRMMCDDED